MIALVLVAGWVSFSAFAAEAPRAVVPAARVIEVYPSSRPGEVLRANVSVIAPAAADPASQVAPQVTQAHGSAPAEIDPAATAVQEAQAARENVQAAYGSVNATNPMSDAFDPTSQQAAIPPEMKAQMESLQRTLENPLVQRYLRLFSNTELMASAQKIIESGALKKLGIYQLIFIVLWLFFRAWVMQGAKTLPQKMGMSLLLGLAYLSLAGFMIPYFVIGRPYVQVISAVVKNWHAPTERLPAAAPATVPPQQ